jgi:predicted lipid-binding transport protein (Tim44 family)
MLRTGWFRLTALLAVLVTAFSLSAVGLAEARFGGSFGSRGYRTYQTLPRTPAAPNVTAPIAKSTTPSTVRQPGMVSPRPGMFGTGLGGWLLGGLVFGGLFGLMFGTGFGGFGGVFALIVQVMLIIFLFRLFFGRRLQTAGGPGSSHGGGYGPKPSAGNAGYAGNAGPAPRSNASRRAGSRDEIGIGDRDLSIFETRLTQLQDAYSREDLGQLRRITTPEVLGYLSDELREAEQKGLRNEVFDVRLLQGEVAEAWREGPSDYATVALHYESRDVMRERSTGTLVSGEDRLVERREVWTFVRHNGGDWLVSAIQS